MNQYPYPVEPMGVGKILDRTFNTYVKKFASFALFTLLVNGLLTLVFFVLEQLFTPYSPFDIAAYTDMFDRSFGDLSDMENYFNRLTEFVDRARTPAWISILSFTASLFVSPIVAGGIAYVTTGHFLGEQHKPGEYFSMVLSKYKSLFVTHVCSVLFLIGIIIMVAIAFVFLFVLFGILTAIVPFLGILLIIGGVVAAFLVAMFISGVFAMVYPITIREGISGFSPAIRALRIGFLSFWKTIGVAFLTGLIVFIVSLIVSFILESIARMAFPSAYFLIPLISLILGLFFEPITSIAMNMHYLSFRIQKEGFLAEPPVVETDFDQPAGPDSPAANPETAALELANPEATDPEATDPEAGSETAGPEAANPETADFTSADLPGPDASEAPSADDAEVPEASELENSDASKPETKRASDDSTPPKGPELL